MRIDFGGKKLQLHLRFQDLLLAYGLFAFEQRMLENDKTAGNNVHGDKQQQVDQQKGNCAAAGIEKRGRSGNEKTDGDDDAGSRHQTERKQKNRKIVAAPPHQIAGEILADQYGEPQRKGVQHDDVLRNRNESVESPPNRQSKQLSD